MNTNLKLSPPHLAFVLAFIFVVYLIAYSAHAQVDNRVPMTPMMELIGETEQMKWRVVAGKGDAEALVSRDMPEEKQKEIRNRAEKWLRDRYEELGKKPPYIYGVRPLALPPVEAK